jgi:hypothetical protein
MPTTKRKPKEDPKRILSKVYGYHPVDQSPDLVVPTTVAARYQSFIVERRPRVDPGLERDIIRNGILHPITLRTNGAQGLITDGNHRIAIAQKLGIEEIPVQVWPDSLRRIQSRAGYPVLESVVKEWVSENLFAHDDHYVTRHIKSGGPGSGGIQPHGYMKCECECGARWREDR